MAETTTGRIQRRDAVHGRRDLEDLRARSTYGHGNLLPAAPAPTMPPGPHGDLSRASIQQLTALTREVWPASRTTVTDRCNAVRAFLLDLEKWPGSTWQDRWEASDFAAGTRRLGRKGTDQIAAYGASAGMKLMFCLRTVRPTLPAFRAHTINYYANLFRTAQADPHLDDFYDRVTAADASHLARLGALFDVSCALTVFGIPFSQLTPAALLQYAWECRHHDVAYLHHSGQTTFGGLLAWRILHAMDCFPPGTPPSLRAATIRGRRTAAQMVDRHGVANGAVRQLLVDYLQRRAGQLDYATLEALASKLAGTFWTKIEQINPRQADLRLTPQVYDDWRAALLLREDGRPRMRVEEILLSVRSLYLDIHTWAAAEPDRWAAWVAPCPILTADLLGGGRRQRRAQERSAARTRARQPLLPLLVAEVQGQHAHMRRLLGHARDLDSDALITIDGRRYLPIIDASGCWTGRCHVTETGDVIDAVRAEETAFWDWAIVETLRHSGIRIEELLELTQLSIRQYCRPNGEVIALLVIAPSKSDRERVIPMSPDLFHVLASVVRRLGPGGTAVPNVTRYDGPDKVYSPPLPFLFQRRIGYTRTAFTYKAVAGALRRLCSKLAERHPSFAEARFTPHDFRRLFATDLVNNGLPIHIGAALLGHLNLETTRGYVAVFEEDLVRHYQTFLDRRRSMRPREEYRPATDAEWQEFRQHFDKRKVELGSCGRPYGTPCVHEHACVRCPMLHVSPAMLGRLDELEADLIARRRRAHQEGWMGEIEGLDLTLSHLRGKRDQSRQLAGATGVMEADHTGRSREGPDESRGAHADPRRKGRQTADAVLRGTTPP